MYFLQRIQQRGLLGLYQLCWKTKKKGANMKPKRYPYCGNKKQPHEEIAELKKQIAVNKSMINHLERAIKKQQGIRH